jgi:hypothetical protein
MIDARLHRTPHFMAIYASPDGNTQVPNAPSLHHSNTSPLRSSITPFLHHSGCDTNECGLEISTDSPEDHCLPLQQRGEQNYGYPIKYC